MESETKKRGKISIFRKSVELLYACIHVFYGFPEWRSMDSDGAPTFIRKHTRYAKDSAEERTATHTISKQQSLMSAPRSEPP